jgi:hypothetical protein
MNALDPAIVGIARPGNRNRGRRPARARLFNTGFSRYLLAMVQPAGGSP